ncbi:aldo/keto reductase [Lentisphaerota bacterium WC36G]|nr:aldo/keto reductase [Lentisphaerae bacterium WC36]
MKFAKLGKSNIEGSVLALGTWSFGGWTWGGQDETAAIDAVHAAIDCGINLIDTAPMYGFGKSEEIVGKAIKDRRNDVIIASKCGLRWDCADGVHFFDTGKDDIKDNGNIGVYRNLRPASIRLEVENSLKRMNIDCIDLMQTHWQDPTTPIEESMGELLKLQEEGKIRAIGASNATVNELKQYLSVGDLVVNQEKYSMIDYEMEDSGQLNFCADSSIAFLAYSPMAQGLLSGKVTPERKFNEGDQRLRYERFSTENRVNMQKMLSEFANIAETHNATMAQLVMAWTLQQRGCTHLLVGSRNIQQAKENAASADINLTTEEVASMTAILKEYRKILV